MAPLVLGNKEYPIIRNIIFDLGGVIMNIDYNLTLEAFKKIGFVDFNKMYSFLNQSKLFDGYDKGLVSPEEFRQGLRDVAQLNVCDDEINLAWNAMLIDIPEDRIHLLENLKNHFRTYLLSNTNEIHLDYFFNYVNRTFKIEDFSSLFHKAYYSCRVQMRKPDAEIFLKVINENNLKPSETLFIDDYLLNIESAEKLGIQCYYLQKEEFLTSLFAYYLK